MSTSKFIMARKLQRVQVALMEKEKNTKLLETCGNYIFLVNHIKIA